MADNFYYTDADRNEWVCSKCWALVKGPWRDNHMRWHADMPAVDASPNGIPASTPQLLLSVATGHATSAVLPSTAPKVLHDLLAAIKALRKRAWGTKDLKTGDVFKFHGTEFQVSGKDCDGRPFFQRTTLPGDAAQYVPPKPYTIPPDFYTDALRTKFQAKGLKEEKTASVNCPCLNPQCPHESHKQPVTLQPSEVEWLEAELAATAKLPGLGLERSAALARMAATLRYKMRRQP